MDEAEEENDGTSASGLPECGLWKRVSKFNLTECRGVQPHTPFPLPHCFAASRGHLLCILSGVEERVYGSLAG